jgi:hypothetical protein
MPTTSHPRRAGRPGSADGRAWRPHVPGHPAAEAQVTVSTAQRRREGSGKACASADRHTSPPHRLRGGVPEGPPAAGGRWDGVGIPVLVLAGGKSPAWMRTAMRALSQAIPGATLHTLQGQTHMLKPKVTALCSPNSSPERFALPGGTAHSRAGPGQKATTVSHRPLRATARGQARKRGVEACRRAVTGGLR